MYDVREAVSEGALRDGDRLGASFATLGEFPGVPYGTLFAAGLRGADGPGASLENSGEVWLLRLKPNGYVQKLGSIGPTQISEINAFDVFGDALAHIGDLDGDGLPELAVGAPFTEVDGVLESGAIYICFLDSTGALSHYTRISNGSGGLPPGLISSMSRFGSSIASVGDLDGNGVNDIVVGAPHDQTGGVFSGGALYLLFLNEAGQVINYRVINSSEPLLSGRIDGGDFFGSGLAGLPGFGPGGRDVLAVGAWGADGRGRVHLLSFTSGGIVNRNVELSFNLPILGEALDLGDAFGYAISNIGDLNGDGIDDLAVAAPGDDDSDDGIPDKGAVYILYLQKDGLPQYISKISETSGGLGLRISSSDFFGSALGAPGDVDQDGLPDLLIGSRNRAVDGVRTGNFFLARQEFCRTPGNPTVTITGPTSAQCTWEGQPLAQGYLIQTRVSGSSGWSNNISYGPVYSLDTLDPGETYDWRVLTGCGSTISFASATETLTMPVLRSGAAQVLENPVRGTLALQLQAEKVERGYLSIWSTDGRLTHRQHLQIDGATSIQIDAASTWPAGFYWLEWSTEQGQRSTAPFQLIRD